jgi:cobaltochelatase CobN
MKSSPSRCSDARASTFRDVFPAQIALLHRAIQDVAARDESLDDNPLVAHAGAELARLFGAAPGRYGIGLGRTLAAGAWTERDELAAAYLDATSHAYDGQGEGREARAEFAATVAAADAFVHAQDLPGQDVLRARGRLRRRRALARREP